MSSEVNAVTNTMCSDDTSVFVTTQNTSFGLVTNISLGRLGVALPYLV